MKPTPQRNFRLRGTAIIVFVSVLAAVTVFSLSYSTAVAPLGVAPAATPTTPTTPAALRVFDGVSAMRFAQAQCDIGPRPPGTPEDVKTGDYIIKSLSAGWTVEEQKFDYKGVPIRNIIAKLVLGLG